MDLPEDQIRASKNAITLSDTPNDFNYFDWSWSAPPDLVTSSLNAAPQRIDLRPKTKEFGAYNFGRPNVPSIYGRSSTSRHGSQDDTSHLDSQDFSGIDLGLTLDGDISMDVEAGRDAMSNLSRQGSVGMGKRGNSMDIDMGDMGGMDMGFEGVDLGLDFGAQDAELPALEARSRRESESSQAGFANSSVGTVYPSSTVTARDASHPTNRSHDTTKRDRAKSQATTTTAS